MPHEPQPALAPPASPPLCLPSPSFALPHTSYVVKYTCRNTRLVELIQNPCGRKQTEAVAAEDSTGTGEAPPPFVSVTREGLA